MTDSALQVFQNLVLVWSRLDSLLRDLPGFVEVHAALRQRVRQVVLGEWAGLYFASRRRKS